MPSATWVRVTLGLGAIFWFVATLATDIPVDGRWLRPLGLATSGVIVALLLFDQFFWRWLPQKIIRHPKLRGTWKADLVHEWPAGQRQSKECYVVIRQTFSIISVTTLFDISKSSSRTAGLRVSDGQYELWYVYWSEANVLERLDNAPHRGAVNLSVSFAPRLRMEGEYWTDRRTVGLLRAGSRNEQLFSDFESARAAIYK